MSQDVSIRVAIEGDEEIQKKIDDLKKSFEDLEKAAKDATRPAEELADALKDVAQTDAASKVEDTDEAFKNLKTSADDAQTTIEDFNTAAGDTDTKAEAASSSLDTLDASYSSVSTFAADAQTNIASSVDSLEGIDSAGQGASSGLDAVGTAFEGVSSSATEANQNIQEAVTGIEGIGTSTGQAESAMSGLGSAFEGAGTSANTMNDALGGIGDQMQGVTGGLTQANTSMQQFGSSAQQAGQSAQGLGSSMGVAVGFFGTAASAAVGLATNLNNLHGAQIRVDQMTKRLSEAQEKEAKAVKELNDLRTSGTASAEELAQAELDVAQAHDGTAIAIERLQKGQTDLDLRMARFGSDTIPQVIQTVTSLVGALSQVKSSFEGIKWSQIATGAAGVTAAVAALVTGIELLNAVQIKNEFFDENTLEGRIQKMKDFKKSIEDIPVVGQIQGPKIQADIDQLEALKKKYDEQGIVIPKVNELTQNYGSTLQNHAGGTKTATNATAGLNQEMGLTPEEALQAAEAIGNVDEFQGKLEKSAALAANELTNQRDTVGELTSKIEAGRSGIDAYVQGIDNVVKGSEPWDAAIQKNISSLNEQTDTLNRAISEGKNFDTVMAEQNNTFAEHATAIDKLNITLNTAEGAHNEYVNAVAAGNEKFLQFVQDTRNAATETETYKTNLKGLSDTFGGLPGFMEGTIQEYEAFIKANQQGGDAIDEFEDMALESWRNLVSEAQPLFDDLKAGWKDVFSQESAQEVQSNIQEISSTFTDEFTKLQKELGEIISAPEFDQAKYQDILSQMDELYRTQISDMAEATSTEFTDPVMAAFDKLPPAVAATLDETERSALAFQAKMSTVAEEAGTAWADNLQANMSKGFDQALQEANQAAQEVLAPFIQQHPETAQMFQPLFDKMNEVGPGAGQAVQEVLQELSGMPGPVGEVATQMLNQFNEKFGDQLPTKMKTGVENSIDAMSQNMTTGFQKIVDSLNNLIKEIKQDPADIPKIDADTNPANQSIQTIERSLTAMQTHMNENKLFIAINTTPAEANLNSLTAKIDGIKQDEGMVPDIKVTTVAGSNNVAGLQSEIDQLVQDEGSVPDIKVTTVAGSNNVAGLQSDIDQLKQDEGSVPDIKVTTVAGSNNVAGLQSDIQALGQLEGEAVPDVKVTTIAGSNNVAGLQSAIDALGQLEGEPVPDVKVTTVAGSNNVAGLQSQIDQLIQDPARVPDVKVTTVAGSNNVAGLQSDMDALAQDPQRVPDVTVNIQPGLDAIQRLQTAINGIQGPGAGGYAGGAGGFQGFQGGGFNAFARGFGPAFINKPTRMLVGEAGPELVSVVPVKNQNRFIPTMTAQTGQGYQPPSGQGGGPSTRQMEQAVERGSEQGSEQGVQQGMQQGYQQAPSNTELFGAGRFSWSPGGGMGGGGGAQYPQANYGTDPTTGFPRGWGYGSFTWGGGAQGMNLGQPPGRGGGAQYPTAPSNTELFGRPQTFKWTGGKMGTSLAQGATKSFVKEFQTGMKGQSQLINGVPATILSGNQNPAQQAGLSAGQSAGSGFAQGFNQAAGQDIVKPGDLFPMSMSSIGTPPGGVAVNQNVPAYTGKVPASYGPPLGQSINGVRATILPGQKVGGSGIANLPELQPGFYGTQWGGASAQGGMHKWLKRNTMIAAHRGERVDIGRGGGGQMSDKMLANLMRMLTKLMRMQGEVEVNFNVDGAKLGHVANRNMGQYTYGDRGG